MSTTVIAEQQWLFLSETLVGYQQVDLVATGVSAVYLSELTSRLAPIPQLGRDLKSLITQLQDGGNANELLQAGFKAELGWVLRNIITMWMGGYWQTDHNGNDINHVISTEAYRQGLIWDTIGTHPMGSKPAGFGSWALPPKPYRDISL